MCGDLSFVMRFKSVQCRPKADNIASGWTGLLHTSKIFHMSSYCNTHALRQLEQFSIDGCNNMWTCYLNELLPTKRTRIILVVKLITNQSSYIELTSNFDNLAQSIIQAFVSYLFFFNRLNALELYHQTAITCAIF